MLETLVPSRIRRTLLEHVLSHPDDRVYLRGLAKELNLSISPLRRELVRLEQLGFFHSYEEANARFYVLNRESPVFTQLQQALAGSGSIEGHELAVAAELALPEESAKHEVHDAASAGVLTGAAVERLRRADKRPIAWASVFKATGVMAMISLLLLGLGYLVFANRELTALVRTALPSNSKPAESTARVEPARVVAGSATSGEMRSSRWRVVPGAIGGGFVSEPANAEPYGQSGGRP